MRLPITLVTAAAAFALAAGPAQADTSPRQQQQSNVKAVVVLIGANDYGVVAPDHAPAFTPPIGTDKGSATGAQGIIAILIG